MEQVANLLPQRGDKVKVKSDNAEVYESFTMDFNRVGEDVVVIGMVVWAGRGF